MKPLRRKYKNKLLLQTFKRLMADRPLETFLREWRMNKVRREIHTYRCRYHTEPILLDFGCGFNCLFLKRVKTEIKKGYGIDPKADDLSNEKIQIIKHAFKDKLPFKNRFFDIVTSIAVVEHIKKIDLLLQEFYRVLKSKGVLIVTSPTNRSKKILYLLAEARLLNPQEIYEHKRHLSPNSMRRLIQSHGFRTLKIEPFQLGFNCLYFFQK